MTATDLCHLASAAFPGLTFTPIDFGRGLVRAQSPRVGVVYRPDVEGFTVVVRGNGADYQGAGDTIADAHRDALACRAEYEPEVAPAPTVQGTLDL